MVHDAFGNLASLVWSQLHREPIARESHSADDGGALVADLCVQGVWLPQCDVLFDIGVVDTDAPFYSRLSPQSAAESEKKWLNSFTTPW